MQMTNRKRKFIVIALVALLLTLLAQNTLAYYTSIGKATNVVTSGDIKLRIHETTTGGKPFPVEEGVEVIPGDVVDKRVFVENVCDHPFWLRVKLVYGTNSKTLDPQQVLQITDLNEKQWILHEGYYYYYRPLQPKQKTEPLFESVLITGSLVDQHNAEEMLSLTVKTYAVQSENNPGANPWDVSGWPVD